MVSGCHGSLRACINCWPMHLMSSERSEVALTPNFSCGRCVRMLAVFLGILHIFLVSFPMIWPSFLMSGLENGTA